jgi:hypothetical protein
MRTATFPIERRTEMFRKLPTVLPIAILLAAASAAPALAQTGTPRAAKAYAFAASASQGHITCPTLEGYPDCHPSGRAPWTIYSSNSRAPRY